MREPARLLLRYGVGYAGATVLAVVGVARVLPVGRSLLLFGVAFVALGVGGLLLRGPMTAEPGEAVAELQDSHAESFDLAHLDRQYAVGLAYTLGVFLLAWVALIVPLLV
ncbi:hypothetical protein [Halosegnis sp.]|uniref:hypothetical protein n=1 Tax=Halosegnis sp. TaxID=2864959 RepID=UPI0035D3FD0B